MINNELANIMQTINDSGAELEKLRQMFSHVIWIGGATDSGKTSVADKLAEKYGYNVYHYDRHDARHHEYLSKVRDEYKQSAGKSLDDSWVNTTPQVLFEGSLNSFKNRLPLALTDILELPSDKTVIAEGYGLLPQYIKPLLSSISRGIWLIPTRQFKEQSFERRGKPSFRNKVSDPEKAHYNLFTRDMLLADYISGKANELGLNVCIADGSRTIDEMAEYLHEFFML